MAPRRGTCSFKVIGGGGEDGRIKVILVKFAFLVEGFKI